MPGGCRSSNRLWNEHYDHHKSTHWFVSPLRAFIFQLAGVTLIYY